MSKQTALEMLDGLIQNIGEELLRDAREDQRQRDEQQAAEAKRIFEEKENLEEAIRDKIFPALRTIETFEGNVGSAFFFGTNYLISNAHVFPRTEQLVGSQLISSDSNSQLLLSETAYYRPFDNDNAPDLVIVKCYPESRDSADRSVISREFTDDIAHDASYFFYVDLSDTENQQIKYLTKKSGENDCPLIFSHDDGLEPQPGSSGSPIIEARVIRGSDILWQFRVVGALYARCLPSWHSGLEAKETSSNSPTRQVVAIPIANDLKQVLGIIYGRENANRLRVMSQACEALNDDQARIDREDYSQQARLAEKKVEQEIHEFQCGVTDLNIELPEGLEKLWRQWRVCEYVGIPEVYKKHPSEAVYNVSPNHSNHHIIPIGELLYLWDYLHNLSLDEMNSCREQAKNEAKNERITRTRELRRDIETNYSNDRGSRYPDGVERINREIEILKAERLRKLKKEKLNQHYKRFYKLLRVLLLPYIMKGNSQHENKKHFIWACWNLFKGWDKNHRIDDPSGSSESKSHDYSEKTRPSSFNPKLWNLLKREERGLYHRIRAMKELKEKNLESKQETKIRAKIENELHKSLHSIANFWERESKKVVHPYKASDWELRSRRCHDKEYALKS